MTNKVSFEATPNPSTVLFRFSTDLVDGNYDFPTVRDADASPLASKIFGFPWTSRIHLGPNFISVTKQDWVDWDILAEPLCQIIQEHLELGLPLIVKKTDATDSGGATGGQESSLIPLDSDSDIIKQIKEILARDIRPVVALDGGDIGFAKFENNILYIHMKGSCAGCPSSQATLKEGIEVRLKELLPQIQEVVSL